jgi:hypothetical protein
MFLSFNTGIMVKGKIVLNRKIISLNYLKQNFIVDVISTFPLVLIFFEIDIPYYQHISILNFLKLFILKDRIERLSFYFSFEKNCKNIVDLLKLMMIILFIGHFFACFWHGIGLIEIYYLNRTDTWIHFKNITE